LLIVILVILVAIVCIIWVDEGLQLLDLVVRLL
jgi:hypothetical protein